MSSTESKSLNLDAIKKSQKLSFLKKIKKLGKTNLNSIQASPKKVHSLCLCLCLFLVMLS